MSEAGLEDLGTASSDRQFAKSDVVYIEACDRPSA